MNTNLTEIAVVVDRSGSMHEIWTDTLGGLKQFLADQQKLEGEANFNLNVFDNEFLPLVSRLPIRQVDLEKFEFPPRGNTALYDAIGRTVSTLAQQIASTKETERPAKVVVAIFTDGAENASSEYNRKRVFDLIQQKETQDGWSFLYMAAGKEAMIEGEHLGIQSNKRVLYEATGEEAKLAYENLTEVVASNRASSVNEFRASRDTMNLTESFARKKAAKAKKV
jgi:hypothetical protein